ncbi:prolyl oligopeptidase family serine peptidase [Tundrisphaera lichenicola]|uniref:prolyl oligopeptidase family serine peptidase n=1 Tax=Tundrisphaera lichenicola TaxID=2029860 RepID=UPI003EB9A225
MAITFDCPGCGKGYSLGDEVAGKKARCKSCGQVFRVPLPDEEDEPDNIYGLEDVAPPEPVSSIAADPGVVEPRKDPSLLFGPRGGAARKDEKNGESWKKSVGGILSVVVVLGGFSLRIYNRVIRPRMNNQPVATADAGGFANPAMGGPVAPTVIPPFPEAGPGHELDPGVTFQEVRLPGGSQPGWSGKLWLYRPTGEHAPRSLPCVMITGAGSNLLTGMSLSDGDRPEHVPYVRAGFAVLAYELDGGLEEQDPSEARLRQAIGKFQAARAGLVNAAIALAFLRERVPAVDPNRVYTAGHSSAGTMAMLFAEHAPELKGCVAFAPAIDLVKRFGPAMNDIQALGCLDLATRYSPKDNESKLACPLFLFHAQGDGNVPVQDSEASAERLRQMGKSVTLEVVPGGDHYNSMMNPGISRAIEWLRKIDGGAASPAPNQPTAATNEIPPRSPVETPDAPDPIPADSIREAKIRSFQWLDADSDYLGGHGNHDKPDRNPDQHFRLVLDLPPDTLIKGLTITSGFNKWVTKATPNLWSVGVVHEGKVVTLEQVDTVGTFSGTTTLDLYVNSGMGIGPGTMFEIQAVVRADGIEVTLGGRSQRPPY